MSVTMQSMIDNLITENVKAQRQIVEATDRLREYARDERGGLPVDEAAVIALRGQKDDLRRQVEAREARIAEIEDAQRADIAANAMQAQTFPTGVTKPGVGTATLRVGQEPRTYGDPRQNPSAPSFLRDLFAAQVRRDPAALGRLERHGREVEVDNPKWAARAANTGAVSGFTPPQYIADLFAEYARAGRPTANLCTPLPLPEVGMTVNIPRVTTGTIVGAQATENATVSNQDVDDTLLTVPVRTIAGYTDVSRQAVERTELVEQVIFADLAAAYSAELDRQIINGTGSSGEHLGLLGISGINAVTYTDASPTAGELWPKLVDAITRVQSVRFTGATGIVLHPKTWAMVLAGVDTTGRPLFNDAVVAQNPMGVASESPAQYGMPVGTILGIPVVVDGNVPINLGAGTNETRLIVADFRDIFLMEDTAAPVQLRFDEPLSSSLGVRLLAYGYSAFAGGRQPSAISAVAGTGMIPVTL